MIRGDIYTRVEYLENIITQLLIRIYELEKITINQKPK